MKIMDHLLTSTKTCFYDTVFKTVLKNRLRNEGGDISVIWGRNIIIYVAHSKVVSKNRLKIEPSGIFIIRRNKTTSFITQDHLCIPY